MADNTKVEYTLSLKDLFTGKIRQATGETEKLNGVVGKTQAALGGLGSALSGIAAGFAAVDIVKTTAQFESMQNAIKAGSVSADEGGKNISFLSSEIERLNLDVNAAYSGFKTWQGAIKGTSLDGEQGRKIFSQFGEAITAMGLSGDDATGVFLALGQMVSKGKVQAEELRGQLGERLPGAFLKAASAMGMTTAELDKFMADGKLTADMLLPKLAQALHDEFAVKAASASNSLQGNLNKLNNEFEMLKVELGNAFMPIILKVMAVMRGIISVFKQASEFIKEHRVAVSFLAGSLGGLVAVMITYEAIQTAVWVVNGAKAIYNLWAMAAALEGTTIAQIALNTATAVFDALTSNYVALAAGAAVLAAGIWAAYDAQTALNEAAGGSKTAVSDTTTRGAMGLSGEIATPGMPTAKPSAAKAVSGKIGGGTQTSSVEARQATNFNITIEKLVEKLSVETTNMKEGSSEVKALVTKALIEAVNDFQLMATK